MEIELEEPFKSIWKTGHLITNAENRQHVVLFNSNQNKSLISYARYLVCVKLGYILSSDFEVDHKDDDKTNDDINNLQVLTSKQNKLKQQYNYIMNEQVCYGFYCAYCEIPFILTEREVKMRLAQKVELAFCSHACSTKYYPPPVITLTCADIERIKNLREQGLSSYKISEITGFARNTVMKYWE